MIEVLKTEDKDLIKETYSAKNIEYNDGDMLISATENGVIIGQILFSATDKEIIAIVAKFFKKGSSFATDI